MAEETPQAVLVGPDGLPLVQAFPKMLYHAAIGQRIVATADEEAALVASDPTWSDTPGQMPEIDPPPPPETP